MGRTEELEVAAAVEVEVDMLVQRQLADHCQLHHQNPAGRG